MYTQPPSCQQQEAVFLSSGPLEFGSNRMSASKNNQAVQEIFVDSCSGLLYINIMFLKCFVCVQSGMLLV